MLKVFLSILLISGSLFAYTGNNDSGVEASNFRSYEVRNLSVTNNGSISRTFDGVASYSTIDFAFTTSSGSITTANVMWQLLDGTYLSTSVLYAGSPITKFKSNKVKVTAYNRTGGTVTVTGNIILTKQSTRVDRRLKTQTAITVGTSLTTVTVSAAQAGFWSLRPSQDIQVNFTGNTNALYPIYANEPFSSSDYIKQGDIIKLKATTTTTSVKVAIDE